VTYGGEPVYQTILEHVLDVLKREAARGKPSMMAELSRISNKLKPPPEDQRGGFLVVPAPLTHDEWIAQAEKRNATARDPSLPWEPDRAKRSSARRRSGGESTKGPAVPAWRSHAGLQKKVDLIPRCMSARASNKDALTPRLQVTASPKTVDTEVNRRVTNLTSLLRRR
jgi:hypothetical protein